MQECAGIRRLGLLLKDEMSKSLIHLDASKDPLQENQAS